MSAWEESSSGVCEVRGMQDGFGQFLSPRSFRRNIYHGIVCLGPLLAGLNVNARLS